MAAEVANMTVGLSFDGSKLESSMKKVAKGAQTYSTSIENAASKAITVITAAATAATAAFIKSSLDVTKEFDTSMSQVAATLGYSVEELNNSSSTAAQNMQKLRDFAQEMGRTTVFSARQAAEALNYMALAGYDADTSIKMLPNVLNLAAAGSMELATASDMVTDAQTALGLSLDQTSTMVDQMAKAASRSNTSVAQLGEAILTVGGTARYMQGGTQELTTVLGVLADNGIKGAEAGTHLRNMLLRISAPTSNGIALLNQLGVKIFDADGKMRNFAEIFPDLNKAMADFTDEQRIQAFSELFNVRDMSTATALLETTTERWAELGTEIENSADAAKIMAAVQLDNLEGDMTLFQSALEGAQIQLGKKLEPTLRKIVQWATENIGPFVENLGDGIENVVNFVIDNKDNILGLLKNLSGFLTGFLAMGIAAKVKGLFAVITAFAHTNPLILAFSAIVAAITFVIVNFEDFKKTAENVFSAIGSAAEFVGAFFSVVFEDAFNSITSIFSGIGAFFSGVWNTIVGIFTGIGTTIGDAVSGAFKAVVNTILGFVEGFINTPVRAINALIDVINAVPGIEIGHLDELKLPRLAQGGLATGASTAIIGEAGTEAVLPLERNTGNWSGLLASALADEFEDQGYGERGIVVNFYDTTIRDDDDIKKITQGISQVMRRQAV